MKAVVGRLSRDETSAGSFGRMLDRQRAMTHIFHHTRAAYRVVCSGLRNHLLIAHLLRKD